MSVVLRFSRSRSRLFSGILLLGFGIFLSQSCDRSPSTTGITGTVSVVGTDAGNVVVRLYERPDITDDVSPWSVTEREPSVGFTYESQRSFDYRINWELATDTTDAQGKFSFGDIPAGDYIVVADGVSPNPEGTQLKEHYGWSKPKDVHADGSEVDVGLLTLYPDTVIGLTNIFQEITIPEGSHWVFTDNVFIGNGGSLILEPGAVIRLGSLVSITINSGGELRCVGTADNYCIITADEVVARDPAEWLKLEFKEGAEPPQFRYCRIDLGLDGISTFTDGGFIEYCYFHRCTEALRTNNVDPPVFRRNVVHQAGNALHFGVAAGILVEHNLFQTCQQFSISMKDVDDAAIFCNWFRDGGGSDSLGGSIRGVMKIELARTTEIYQNSFETSWFALTVGSFVDSNVRIHHNTFNRINTVLYIGVTEDERRYSEPVFDNNCMTNIGHLYAHFAECFHNSRDINASNNYWNGNTSPQSIQNTMLWDCVRQPADPSCPCFLLDPIMASCGQIEALTDTAAGVCRE